MTIKPNYKFYINENYFSASLEDKLETEKEKELFNIIKRIFQEGLLINYDNFLIENSGIPEVEFAQLKNRLIKLLVNYDLKKFPIYIRMRICEFIWFSPENNSKYFRFAQELIEDHLEMINLIKEKNHNYREIFVEIEKILKLCKKLNQKQYHSSIVKLCKEEINYMKEENIAQNTYRILNLINLIIDFNLEVSEDLEIILNEVFTIFQTSYEFINIKKSIRVLETKISLAEYRYDIKTMQLLKKELNKFIMEKAGFLSQGNIVSKTQANTLYDYLLSNINNLNIDLSAVLRKKQECSRDILENSPLIEIPIPSTNSEVLEKILCNPKYQVGLEFLSDLTSSKLVDIVRKEVKEKIEEIKSGKFELSSLFEDNIYYSSGQKKATISPLNSETIEEEQKLKEYFDRDLSEHIEIFGVIIKNYFQFFLESHHMDSPSFVPIVWNNPIIPKEREKIFLSGLGLGVKGHIYEALHILIPQFENLLRDLVYKLNNNILNYKDRREKVITLGKILDNPDLNKLLGEDEIILLRVLLNDSLGVNLRNDLSHGLEEPTEGSTGASIFFFFLVIRFLFNGVIIKKRMDELSKEININQ